MGVLGAAGRQHLPDARTIGEIAAAPGGADLVLRLLDECRAMAAAEGYPPREAFLDPIRHMLTAAGSPLTASMLRDMENHLRAYEARRPGRRISRKVRSLTVAAP